MSFNGLLAHFFLTLNNTPLYVPQFVHSPTEGHLACIHVLAIMNTAAVSIPVQAFVWMEVSHSFGTTLFLSWLGNVCREVGEWTGWTGLEFDAPEMVAGITFPVSREDEKFL